MDMTLGIPWGCFCLNSFILQSVPQGPTGAWLLQVMGIRP